MANPVSMAAQREADTCAEAAWLCAMRATRLANGEAEPVASVHQLASALVEACNLHPERGSVERTLRALGILVDGGVS